MESLSRGSRDSRLRRRGPEADGSSLQTSSGTERLDQTTTEERKESASPRHGVQRGTGGKRRAWGAAGSNVRGGRAFSEAWHACHVWHDAVRRGVDTLDVARKRWVLAAASAVVSAALAGLGWWVLAGRHAGRAVGPGAGFAPAGALGFLLEPNTTWRHATGDFDVRVTTNSLGLRGPEVTLPKPRDCYRVLTLGDSFTFGWGVELEDAWHARMARDLQADACSMDVVVAGVPGWCPLQQFVFLEQRGLDLQPDLVLWQLCANDLLEMERLDVEIDARRLPIAVAAEPPLSAGLRDDWLVLFEQLDEADRQRALAEYRAGRIDPVLREVARIADVTRRQQAGPAPEGEVSELPAEDVLRGLRSGPTFGIRYVAHMVSAARALCAERGIELRLMLAHPRAKAQPAGAPDDGVAALRAWAAQQTFPVLDTADVLPEGRVDDYFFPKDPHWRPAAHPLVAQAVARWLAGDPALGLSLLPSR